MVNNNHSKSEKGPALSLLEEFIHLMRSPEDGGYAGAKGESALLQHLWFSCQRRRGQFDWILERRCRKVDTEVRHVLYWAMLECYYCQGLPAAVAVNIAAGFAREHIGRSCGGFVNGVMRQLLREAPDCRMLEEKILCQAPVWVRLGLSEHVYKSWRRDYGEDEAKRIGLVCLENASVTGRRRGCFSGGRCGRPYPAGGVMEELDTEFPVSEYYLQDPSTLLAPLLLAPEAGEKVADLCAAPGGKSLILAELMNHSGRLFCCDKSAARLERVRENLKDYPEATIAVMDVTQEKENIFLHDKLDAVLVDVPCSNSGVIRRRPDVRWNCSTAKTRGLVELQRQILERASALLGPSGRIVYSTCSIDGDENHRQVMAFLKEHPDFRLVCERQLLPTSRHDGAYAALMKRS